MKLSLGYEVGLGFRFMIPKAYTKQIGAWPDSQPISNPSIGYK